MNAGPFRRSVPSADAVEHVVDYRMARRQLIDAVGRNEVDRAEVCDAQPELRRVAHHHGAALPDDCPLCESEDLVLVSFAFGVGLPKSGRTISSTGDMRRLRDRKRPSTLYRVEVCRQCWWNFLRESTELPEAPQAS